MRRLGVAFGLMAMQSVWGPPFWGGGGGSSVPTGAIVLIDSGTCPTGYTEDANASAHMLHGTVAANGDVGTTGGSDTITPAGNVTAPIFTGSSATTSAVSAGTPAGTNGTSTVTPLGTVGTPTISWPAGVPTFAGSALATHTHTYTDVVNHVHPNTVALNVQGGTTAATTGTHIMTSTATGGSARAITSGDVVSITNVNPTGGVASGTTAATSAGTPAGTVAWPAGVPTSSTPSFTGSSSTVAAQTFTGSAMGTHTHTLTATGTNSAPTFTGTQFDNRAAYIQVIACKKDAALPSPLPVALGATGAILMLGGRRT